MIIIVITSCIKNVFLILKPFLPQKLVKQWLHYHIKKLNWFAQMRLPFSKKIEKYAHKLRIFSKKSYF